MNTTLDSLRWLRLALLLVGALAGTGCFQLSSVLTVEGDGSGTIQQRLIFSSVALAQLRGLAILGGGNGQGVDPLSEQQARAAAASLGPGVTYVSSIPVDTSEGQGRDIIYAFTDIGNLRLTQGPPIPGAGDFRAQGVNPDQVSFNLTRQPGGTALLRILLPRPSLPGAAGAASPSGATQLPLEQLAAFKQMLAGARLAVVVEPAGRLVRTSSPYVDGRRVTLLDVDFDQLLQSPVPERLQAAQTPEEAKAILGGISGVKLNLEPEITIEFAPTP